jgi:hypothetical protein
MAKEGPPFNASATEWQIYDASRPRRNWIPATNAAPTRDAFLCRFQPSGVSTFQRGVGRFKHKCGNVVCTHFSELTFEEAGRLAHGLHLFSGISQPLPCRIVDEWIELKISKFEVQELVQLLTALSAGMRSMPNMKLKFWFSAKLHQPLTEILQRYGINLIVMS